MTRGFPIPGLLEKQAEKELVNVGDASRGEWREWTGRAFHIRRRLSAAEEKVTGPVADIRGALEARQRAVRLGSLLQMAPPEVLAGELGGAL
jgi:hypothetical protein